MTGCAIPENPYPSMVHSVRAQVIRPIVGIYVRRDLTRNQTHSVGSDLRLSRTLPGIAFAVAILASLFCLRATRILGLNTRM